MCDRELLRTPILGVYLNFLKAQSVFFGDGNKEDVATAWVVRFLSNTLFPKHIDVEKWVPGTAEVVTERRELFGNLLGLIAREGRPLCHLPSSSSALT